MATAIRIIGHEDRLSLVDHLDELRSRLIVCLVACGVVFGICFWQNHALLRIVNAPLEQQTRKQIEQGKGPPGQTWLAQKGVEGVAGQVEALTKALRNPAVGLPASVRAELAAMERRTKHSVAQLPRKPQGSNPTTIGFGEPFTATLTVAFYFAVLISLPLLLFELYGFVLPAFKPQERRVALPLLAAVPILFAIGVAFGYYVVLPAATHFFQNFNNDQFNVLVQTSSYYKFAVVVLIAMGLVFQVPVAILGVTEAGIVSPNTLRKGRRYALVVCAVIAAFIPGEVITMVLETVPLYLLYEGSVWLASILEKRRARRARAQAGSGGGDDGGAGGSAFGGGGGQGMGPGGRPRPGGGSPRPGEGAPEPAAAGLLGAEARGGAATATIETIDPAVREMLDHIDPDLHGKD